MKMILRTLAIVALALLLAGCPQNKKSTGLTETLDQYEVLIRWAQWDGAADYISQEYQEEHPISNLELERLRLFKVTTYNLRSSTPINEGNGLIQIVEIKLFNKHQARERSIIDEQIWKYNEVRERWLLHSGLPDPTQKNY